MLAAKNLLQTDHTFPRFLSVGPQQHGFISSATYSRTIEASCKAIGFAITGSQAVSLSSIKIGSSTYSSASATFNGTATGYSGCYAVLNPPTGTQTIVITLSASGFMDFRDATYANVVALGTISSNGAVSTAGTINVSSASRARAIVAFGSSNSGGSYSNFSGSQRANDAYSGGVNYPMCFGDSIGAGTVTATSPGSNFYAAAVVLLA
jgi:hypothetical protein